jgi:3-oxoacyl-[acyl-carrier protein] reductase
MAERPVAIVTGASRGIGKGIAKELASLGYDLITNHFDFTDKGQQVANWMIEQKKSHPERAYRIVNTGSISAYTSSPARGEYCVSKAGISMMTMLYADRLAEYGIGVFEIRPGIIQTDMTSVVKDKYDKLIAEGLTPIKRWGQPEDIAKAVGAIAEGRLDFSTGQVINVDGGFHLRRL